MASRTDEMTPPSAPDDVNAIEGDIEKTRSSMTSTIEELHGKLNPAVLKDQALDQFREAKEAIKADLRAEIEDVKGGLRRELAEAKSEFRDATIGKVEHMARRVNESVVETRETVVDTIRANPIPAAMAGIGLLWLFMNRSQTSGIRVRERSREDFRGRGYGERGYGERGYERSYDGRMMDRGYSERGFYGDRSYYAEDYQRGYGNSGYQGDRWQNERHHEHHGISDAMHRAQAAGHAVDQVGEMAHNAQDRVGQVAHQVSDAATGAVNRVTSTASDLANQVSDKATQIAQ